MKKRLNFITFLIGIAVGISIMNSEEVSVLKGSLTESMKIGQENADKVLRSGNIGNRLFFLQLEPIGTYLPSELKNKKSGDLIPTRINQAMVKVPVVTEGIAKVLLEFFCSVIVFACLILAVFNFLKIIFAVNKSVIFEWINVKRLRRMGIGFILMFIFGAIITMSHNHFVSEFIDIENYNIVNPSYDGIVLMFGMVSLLVAEIFAVGLRLKEEQDLTI